VGGLGLSIVQITVEVPFESDSGWFVSFICFDGSLLRASLRLFLSLGLDCLW
jgi:hypothetical protein